MANVCLYRTNHLPMAMGLSGFGRQTPGPPRTRAEDRRILTRRPYWAALPLRAAVRGFQLPKNRRSAVKFTTDDQSRGDLNSISYCERT